MVKEILNRNTSIVKHIRKRTFFFTLLSLVISFWFYSQMRNTSIHFLDKYGEEHVLTLPVKDKKRLFYFMRELFAEDSFAYTILGSKPVSWETYQNSLPFVNLPKFLDSFSRYHRTLRLGWKTWLKYRHLFPSTIFFAESSKRHPESVSILIINEEQFNHIVNSNKQDFQNVLQREIVDGFQLLRESMDRSLMNEVLEGHQALMGIVLGYGRNNSWAFLEKSKKHEPLGWVWEETNEEKSEEILQYTSSTDIENCIAPQSLPSFAGIPNTEESMALKREYLLTKQKVIDYYKDKDFLEATLSLLAGFRPLDTSH